MRYYALYCLLICIFFTSTSRGQIGWRWAKANGAGNVSFITRGATVVDRFGNLYNCLYMTSGDSVNFGSITVHNSVFDDVVLVKADSSGNFLWAKKFAPTGAVIQVEGLATDTLGNVYVHGEFGASGPTTLMVDTIAIHSTMAWTRYLAKLSPSGDAIWAVKMFNDRHAASSNVATDDVGNVYVSGSFYDSCISIGTYDLVNRSVGLGHYDMFLAKYSSSGSVLWAKSMGGKQADNNSDDSHVAVPLHVSGNGNVYIAGMCQSDTVWIDTIKLTGGTPGGSLGLRMNFLARFNSSGDLVWAKKLSRSVIISSITTDRANAVYVTGSIDATTALGSFALPFNGQTDIVIGKFDSLGVVKWAKSIGDTGTEHGNVIAADQCGKIWLTAQTEQRETINVDGHLFSPAWAAMDPLLIAGYDSSGNYVNAMLLNGGGGDWNSGLALDRSGNFYIGGTYRFNSPAPPFMVGSYSVPTYGLKAGFFMAKFQYDTSTCYSTPVLPAATATVVNDEVAVYPNPVDEVLYLNGLKEDYAYRLITIAGATVLSGKLRSGNSILCQTLPTGIYLLELTTADQQKTYRKIIKR